jgi:hypothetical protein
MHLVAREIVVEQRSQVMPRYVEEQKREFRGRLPRLLLVNHVHNTCSIDVVGEFMFHVYEKMLLTVD